MNPRRSTSTYTEVVGGEVCVYDSAHHTVHALNARAARVWQCCDGHTSVATMAAQLRAESDEPDADAVVALALAEFRERQLLAPAPALDALGSALSRRDWLRRAGTAAVLPVVTSIVAPTPAHAQSGNFQTFAFTGGAQSFLVPQGITTVIITADGASGFTVGSNTGGAGGTVVATIPVTPGESLEVNVGGAGAAPGGGFNGGGNSTVPGNGAGGGASDVRQGGTALANRVVVAGGGGGAGTHAGGGAGGGLVGADGAELFVGSGGEGGTQSAGGTGGLGVTSGTPGSLGAGGAAAADGGGGGGGGYYGGGGGAEDGSARAGGGGGSSFTIPAATNVTHTQGNHSGHGQVIIVW